MARDPFCCFLECLSPNTKQIKHVCITCGGGRGEGKREREREKEREREREGGREGGKDGRGSSADVHEMCIL